MAAPITHIVLANKVFDDFFPKLSKKDFLIGTSLPDIRYLKTIDRKTTHFNGAKLSLSELNQQNSFMAGAKFHAIADQVREKYVVSQNIYYFLPKSKYATRSLKFLEDELFFDKIDNWEEIIKEFLDISFKQIPFNINQQVIEKWYSLLREYFSSKPNPESRKKFIIGIGGEVI